MIKFLPLLTATAVVLAVSAGIGKAAEPANQLVITTRHGAIVIDLASDIAPNHVQRLKELAAAKFYDGVPFHRVIPGFMAQTGDPTGTGTGKSDKPNLKAEFSKTPFIRGTVGMARSADPNSANSQFFICLGDASWLNGQYTVVGRVSSGMEAVDKIKAAPPDRQSGMVDDPDRILTVTLGNNK
ncbi:MAG: peptidylprolyl isomerase [Alphaproteobacteria bacterium]